MPGSRASFIRQGQQLVDAGRLEEALACIQQGISSEQNPAEVWAEFGMYCIHQERYRLSIESFEHALRAGADRGAIILRLALLHQKAGSVARAETLYTEALSMEPGNLLALNNLGVISMDAHRFDEAVQRYRRTCEFYPKRTDVVFNFAHALARAGRSGDARNLFDELVRSAPGRADILWARQAAVPIIYDREPQLKEERIRWLGGLNTLGSAVRNAADPMAWANAILGAFYMHYECRDDMELQIPYGSLVTEIVERAVPHLMQPLTPRTESGHKIRVGFASAYFRRHTVMKLFETWMTKLDASRFEVFVYHTGRVADEDTLRLRNAVTGFRHVVGDWVAVAETILRDHLDVLVFPEVGMNADTVKVAACRLAPVQCMGWGHPVTSGLKNIDYFISSHGMENWQQLEQRTEALVVLPGIGVEYRRPVRVAPGEIRRELGVSAHRVLYLCCQSLYKYLPRHDKIWPRIASRVPDAHFVFLRHQCATVNEIFQRRLTDAFEAHGLQWSEYCTLAPRLDEHDYLRLNAAADVYLDSPTWSGGNTSLESIAHETPIVTRTGETMRERHTQAMLVAMGLGEWVAATDDEYVELSASLGLNASLRETYRSHVREHSHALFSDRRVLPALEEFLCGVVVGRQALKI